MKYVSLVIYLLAVGIKANLTNYYFIGCFILIEYFLYDYSFDKAKTLLIGRH